MTKKVIKELIFDLPNKEEFSLFINHFKKMLKVLMFILTVLMIILSQYQ